MRPIIILYIILDSQSIDLFVAMLLRQILLFYHGKRELLCFHSVDCGRQPCPFRNNS